MRISALTLLLNGRAKELMTRLIAAHPQLWNKVIEVYRHTAC
jgi:hypothetical protein